MNKMDEKLKKVSHQKHTSAENSATSAVQIATFNEGIIDHNTKRLLSRVKQRKKERENELHNYT